MNADIPYFCCCTECGREIYQFQGEWHHVADGIEHIKKTVPAVVLFFLEMPHERREREEREKSAKGTL